MDRCAALPISTMTMRLRPIALVGCGERERARHIGDAILAALDHDRAWHDGRLRNAYAAGSVRQFPVKLGGW